MAKRNGQWVELAVKDLVMGDVVQLKGGDIIPADCRVPPSCRVHAWAMYIRLTPLLHHQTIHRIDSDLVREIDEMSTIENVPCQSRLAITDQ